MSPINDDAAPFVRGRFSFLESRILDLASFRGLMLQ